MYHKGKDVLSVFAMLSLMSLAVTTARYYLGISFPYDLLIGTAAFLISMIWFVRRAEEEEGSPLVALFAMVIMFWMWLEIAEDQSLLYLGEAWIISALVWLMLTFWVSFGTLLGKDDDTTEWRAY